MISLYKNKSRNPSLSCGIFLLLLLLPTLVRSIVYKSYDGSSASIDPSNWHLLDADCCRDVSLKPSIGDLLLAASSSSSSSLVPVPRMVLSGNNGVATPKRFLEVGLGGPDAPADGSGMQKIHYLVMTGNNFDAPQATTSRSNTGYSGFAFRFEPDYELAYPPQTHVDANSGVETAGHLAEEQNRGTQLWQAWQGSGWPPVQLRTDERDGSISLYLLLSKDDCRGSYVEGCTRVEYLTDPSTGRPLTFSPGIWYRVVIATRADYEGSDGYVAAWVDNAAWPAASHSGTVGYRPESEGGEAGTIDGFSISFGLYRHREDANVHQAVTFDGIKYAQTKEEALPYYTDEELAAMPSFESLAGGGYCSSNYELRDDRGRSLRVESPYDCLKAAEYESVCIDSPNYISFGIGSRAGRCRCDRVVTCSGIYGKNNPDGFDRLAVHWP